MFGINKRIVYARLSLGISQRVLSDFLDKSRSYVAQLETDDSKMTPEVAQELADVFQKIPQKYFYVLEHSPELEANLEMFFQDLLIGNVKEVPELLKSSYPIVSVEQEVSLKILQATYYFKNRKSEIASQIEAQFLNLFFGKQKIEDFPLYIQKYYYLLAYEKHFHANLINSSRSDLECLNKLLENKNEKGALQLKLATLSHRNKLYGKARREIEEAIKLIEDTRYPHLLARSLMLSSVLNTQLYLYEEAKVHLDKLLILAENPELSNFLPIAYQHKGFVLSQRKQFKKAIEQLLLAYSFNPKDSIKIKIIISIIHNQIKIRGFQSAKSYIDKGKELSLSDYEHMILKSYEYQIYLYEGESKKHSSLLKKVLNYFEANQHTEDLSYIYDYLGRYYNEQKSYQKACHYYRKREELDHEKA